MRHAGRVDRRAALALVLTSLALGGCAAEPAAFDAAAPEVQAARQRAVTETAARVRAATLGLPIVHSVGLDACEPAHDDADAYAWRCVSGYLEMAGIRGIDAAAAVRGAERHLKGVGCTGDLHRDLFGLAALDANDRSAVGPAATFECTGGPVWVEMARSDNLAAPRVLRAEPRGPIGAEHVDMAAALLAAQQNRYPYVLVVDLSVTSWEVPRPPAMATSP